MVENQRTVVEYRPYIVVRTVKIWSADDFDVPGGQSRVLDYDCGQVLEGVVAEYCLEQEDVDIAFVGFDNSDIIHVTVIVEIEVGDVTA